MHHHHHHRDSGHHHHGHDDCGCHDRHSGRGEGREHHDEHCRDAGHCHDGHDRGPGGDRSEERGRGPDTRFLHLEMSEVLYGAAESVTKDAFRELLLEAAKARLRERFGNQLTGIAELAVDEVMSDVLANLEIEHRIREHNRQRSSRTERLRDILRGRGSDEGSSCSGEGPEGGGHDPGPGEGEHR
jgi:hypothetical protein